MTVKEIVDDFDIGVATEGDALGQIGADFDAEAKALGLVVATEHQAAPSIVAGIEWVMPTAIALFLGNKYLGTLLQEAAKDHYPLLKSAILKLVRRTTGKDREVTMRVVTTSAAKFAMQIRRHSPCGSLFAIRVKRSLGSTTPSRLTPWRRRLTGSLIWSWHTLRTAGRKTC